MKRLSFIKSAEGIKDHWGVRQQRGNTKFADLDQHFKERQCEPRPEHAEPCRYMLSQDQLDALFGDGWKTASYAIGQSDVGRKWYFVWDTLIALGIVSHAPHPSSIVHLEPAKSVLRREDSCEDVKKYTESKEYQHHLEKCAEEMKVPVEVVPEINNRFFIAFCTHQGVSSAHKAITPPPRPPAAPILSNLANVHPSVSSTNQPVSGTDIPAVPPLPVMDGLGPGLPVPEPTGDVFDWLMDFDGPLSYREL